jgi:putative component of toxin-antitoxin plasmid stabilization module
VQILQYLDAAGGSPYRNWFESLNAQAAAKVTVALTRIELGNLSNVKGVGGRGPRIPDRFRARIQGRRPARDLLAGGTKSRQQKDIATAQRRWADYKKRKKVERAT